MRTGDLVVQLEYWRLCSTTVVRGVAGELEAENWRLGSTTLVHYAPYCGRATTAGVVG